MKDDPNDLWLEPCFGKGAFLHALAQIGVPPQRIVAVDLDNRPSPADHLASSHRGFEFLNWSLSCGQQFSKIVANPPFVSFRKLPVGLKSVAQRLDCRWAGDNSGNSNLWFAFLRASLSLLRQAGTIGFIVPAAFDYAHYAHHLRSRMHKHFESFEVHRCSEPLFDQVQDGCVVLIGRGYKLPNRIDARFEYKSAPRLVRGLGKRTSTRGRTGNASRPCLRGARATTKLKALLTVKIGCVTGDARYFLLRESERVRLKLPVRALRPILTRARHIETAAATRRYWKSLRMADERIWLFRPTRSHKDVLAVARYLRLPAEQGGCNRENFKVKKRQVWYETDLPTKIDGFISGTSRHGPFISFKDYHPLLAANTLYCVEFKKAWSKDERAALALSFLTRHFRKQHAARLRAYPAGLKKVEPGDLAAMRVIRPPENCSGASTQYKKAVRVLITSGRMHAEKVAEQWFKSRKPY